MRGVRKVLAGVVVVVAVAAVLALVLRGGGDESGAPPGNPLQLGSRTIAFACGHRICVWNGRDPRPRALTGRAGRGDASPVWSPDASRIAFLHGDAPGSSASGEGRVDLYVIDADGSNLARVATGLALSPLVLYGPPFAWSPDGTRLAVSLEGPAPPRPAGPRTKRELFDAAITGPASDLHVVDLATRQTRQLTRSAGFDGLPVWSGDRVIYSRLRRNDPRFRSDIRVADAASGSDRLLLRAPSTVNLLALSPDGRRVALATGRAGEPGLTALDIASGRTEILVRRCCASGVSWAPDGRRLAVSGIDGPLLYIADAATGRLRPTAANLPCLGPDWSPDGSSVICHRPYDETDRAGSGSDLVLVDPVTGRRATLTDTASASAARWRPPGHDA
jgi:Tol biopolymer transport system component